MRRANRRNGGMPMRQDYEVYEVEIAPPHRRRLLAHSLSEQGAETFIKMAIARRGVETHFYKAERANSSSRSDSDGN